MTEWIDVNDKLPIHSCAGVTIKRMDGTIQKAFFHADKLAPLAFYGKKLTYWTDSKTYKPIHDVTHWMKPND